MKEINKAVRKKDAMALLKGKPVYTDDYAPKDALIVKLLHSPHASARIVSVDKSVAEKIPGIVGIYTYEDVPKTRFTIAGQSFPETSPYDHLILDSVVRYVGDAVAIVAGETEDAVNRALSVIKVKYDILPAVLDVEEALDHPVRVHAEDDAVLPIGLGYDPTRNIVATDGTKGGDVDRMLSECKYVVSKKFYTKKVQQSPAESVCAFAQLDSFGRLNVTTSTQIVFHVRRILAKALEMNESMIRVIKPRIGGGFGLKQTALVEMYPAFVTMRTGRASKIVYTRTETMKSGNPRHAMVIQATVGADENGHIRAIKQNVLSDTGAYGEHGFATLGLSGRQPLSLYRYVEDYDFTGMVVYTNTTPAGAFRGFGIPQGSFAVESCINELAHQMKMDPLKLRLENVVEEGDPLRAYGQTASSCKLRECLLKAKEMFDWDNRKTTVVLPDGRIQSAGVAMTMQGSGIAKIDTASATIELLEGGTYRLKIGAADMGTGCDTILAQIAAECLNCSVDDVNTFSADTDISPYDTGSYASSTTYVTGGAVVKACEALKEKLIAYASEKLSVPSDELEYMPDKIAGGGKELLLTEIVKDALVGNTIVLSETRANSQDVSPSPFMVGMAQTVIDPLTGDIEVTDYVGVIDCGTVINKALATVQTEGAILQGIGMALWEDALYSPKGKLYNDSLLTYDVPSRMDCPSIRVGFCESYEPTGPFGAKSIGEVAINTSTPAVAEAVYAATGYRATTLPIRSEDVAMYMLTQTEKM